jgi:hypothetical protein
VEGLRHGNISTSRPGGRHMEIGRLCPKGVKTGRAQDFRFALETAPSSAVLDHHQPQHRNAATPTSRHGAKLLPHCNYFVEQRENRSMTPHVVDVDECGAPVQRTHRFDGKIVSRTAIIGYLVSRHDQCA